MQSKQGYFSSFSGENGEKNEQIRTIPLLFTHFAYPLNSIKKESEMDSFFMRGCLYAALFFNSFYVFTGFGIDTN